MTLCTGLFTCSTEAFGQRMAGFYRADCLDPGSVRNATQMHHRPEVGLYGGELARSEFLSVQLQ